MRKKIVRLSRVESARCFARTLAGLNSLQPTKAALRADSTFPVLKRGPKTRRTLLNANRIADITEKNKGEIGKVASYRIAAKKLKISVATVRRIAKECRGYGFWKSEQRLRKTAKDAGRLIDDLLHEIPEMGEMHLPFHETLRLAKELDMCPLSKRSDLVLKIKASLRGI